MPAPSTRLRVLSERRLLMALALVLGLGEFADTFNIGFREGGFWEGAAVFSALFLVGRLWVRRGGLGGPILVAALCVFELQSFPTWKRTGLDDWIPQIAFVAGSAICLVVAIGVLRAAFAARRSTSGSVEHGASE